MKTDAPLKANVLAEFAWDPAINPAAVGVMARNALVTLTGHLEACRVIDTLDVAG